MTREPITAKPETNLLECSRMMVKKKVGSLLLVAGKHLVGIITEWDILWALTKKSQSDLKTITAIDISPRKIATIKPSATIEQAFEKMKSLKFERLPVLHKKELVGLLTVRDVLNFHPEFYHELDEFTEIREESKKLKRIRNQSNLDFPEEGICEECGAQDILHRVEGMLICESCMNSN